MATTRGGSACLTVVAIVACVALLAPGQARGALVCVSDSECDDGLYCNGVEKCSSLTRGRMGICRAGTPPCPDRPCYEDLNRCSRTCRTTTDCNDRVRCTIDRCDADGSCRNESPDTDGDGHSDASCRGARGVPLGDDCDDHDALRYPGATEVCDAANRDEDCNSATFGARDADSDGYVDVRCCNAAGGYLLCGSDCDDLRDGVHPGLPEVCNTVDDNCDGATDEGVSLMQYRDLDGDGHGQGLPFGACAGAAGFSLLDNDCDDGNPAIRPGALMCESGAANSVNVLICTASGSLSRDACLKGLVCVVQPNGTGVCTTP